jgi:hypothetical protein
VWSVEDVCPALTRPRYEDIAGTTWSRGGLQPATWCTVTWKRLPSCERASLRRVAVCSSHRPSTLTAWNPSRCLPTMQLTAKSLVAMASFASSWGRSRTGTGPHLCDMLASRKQHEWRQTDTEEWERPPYFSIHMGGSDASFPSTMDLRQFTSFWGSNSENFRKLLSCDVRVRQQYLEAAVRAVI